MICPHCKTQWQLSPDNKIRKANCPFCGGNLYEELLEPYIYLDIEFIEASACTGGCTGGPLTVENMYVAKNRSRQQLEDEGIEYKPIEDIELQNTAWEKEIKPCDVHTLE